MDKTRVVYNYKEKGVVNRGVKDEKELGSLLSRFGIGAQTTTIEDVKKEIGD